MVERRTLESAGYNVEVVRSGDGAIHLIDEQQRAGMFPAQEAQVAASIGGLLAELHRREPEFKAALRSETRRFKKIVPELRVLKAVGEAT